MLLQAPFSVVTPTVDGDVLAIVSRADVDFTTGQLGKLLPQHSVSGIRKVCQRLERQGILRSAQAGPARTYRFNRDHVSADAIIDLAHSASRLWERMRSEVSTWERPADYIAIFGSAARGTMTEGSDIDVFLVRPDDVDAEDPVWTRQLFALVGRVAAWSGNDCRILEYDHTELDRGLLKRERVLLDIRDERIHIAGSPGTMSQTSLALTK